MARLFVALALLVALLPIDATATSVLYLTDAEQARQSDAVVLAEVREQRVEWHARWKRAVTVSTVVVGETLAGEAPAEIEVHQLKGTLDGVTYALPGSMNLRVGEEVVLFLHVVDGVWYPTALEQSKYAVERSRLGVHLSRPPLTASLYARDDDGALRPTSEPPRKPVYTLDDLRRAIAVTPPAPPPLRRSPARPSRSAE